MGQKTVTVEILGGPCDGLVKDLPREKMPDWPRSFVGYHLYSGGAREHAVYWWTGTIVCRRHLFQLKRITRIQDKFISQSKGQAAASEFMNHVKDVQVYWGIRKTPQPGEGSQPDRGGGETGTP